MNLNNMIPVREEYITEINLKAEKDDTQQMRQWKKLCIKELNWCQTNQNEIERLANELYKCTVRGRHLLKEKSASIFPHWKKNAKRQSISPKRKQGCLSRCDRRPLLSCNQI